jgi:hypothetical protein
MATARTLAANKLANLNSNKRRLSAIKAEMDALINTAERRGTDLSQAEAARINALASEADTIKESILSLQAEHSRYTAMADEDDAAACRTSSVPVAHSTANRVASFHVGRNERTYNQGNDEYGRNFLLDVSRAAIFNDQGAKSRLDRHTAEESVERNQEFRTAGDANTTSFGVGLVVPSFLTDLYAPAVANMRPLADNVNRQALPPNGMTLNLSKITTPTSADLQANQLDDVSHTSIGQTDLAINVQTAAGRQNVSRQAIERGTGIENVTMGDLLKRVATVIDYNLINQSATGLLAVAQGVTYTSASPTAAEMWPYLFQAESKLETALLGQARVDLVVMHSRRWNWLCSQVGSTWPFMGAGGQVDSQQGGVILTNQYGPGIRGVLSNGLKVVVDNNVPTNVGGTQDPVFVCASEEIFLWEDPGAPTLIRAEQPLAANLGIQLVVYEYWAAATRYANTPVKITGTGCAAPANF